MTPQVTEINGAGVLISTPEMGTELPARISNNAVVAPVHCQPLTACTVGDSSLGGLSLACSGLHRRIAHCSLNSSVLHALKPYNSHILKAELYHIDYNSLL